MKKLGEGSTPGPWNYQRRRSDEYLINAGGAGYIATVYSAMVDDGEFEANARLIAKAPLLVEARDVLFVLAEALAQESDDAESAEDSEREEWARLLCHKARALLAKLEGE